MNLEMIARTMQFILAPAVMINACAVIITGLLGHYAVINARLRDMNRERLAQLRLTDQQATTDAFTLERLGEIDAQLPELLHRHRLIRDAVLFVYGGVFFFVTSMLVIAVANALNLTWVSVAALIVFLVGTALVLAGVFTVALEIRRSHLAVEFEVNRVSSFGHDARVAVAPRVSNP
jgi:Protein of unknown function (DUF2721)